MDEIKDPTLKKFEEAAANELPTNPLLAFTKVQIGKLMADGALLASIKQHGVSADALSAVVKNTKLSYTLKPDQLTDVTFKFDPSKNGFHVNATFKF